MSTEAFIVLAYENQHAKYVAGYKYLHENDLETMPPKTKATKHLPHYKTLYTDCEGGNNLYGGWSIEGMERMIDLMKEIQAYRKENKDIGDELEEEMLRAIQRKKGIKALTVEEETKRKRQRNKPAPVIDASKAARLKRLKFTFGEE